jgi:16S rRNA (cytosine967-C5)-methyltransferase
MQLARLREVPWEALRADVALPAIGRTLAGAPAEREVDRALRSHRGLSREERAAVVESIFGVALWRRRLAWQAGVPHPIRILSRGSDIPRTLLACLLRDLAGLPEPRALALCGLDHAPPQRPAPARLADRWSLPDWLEQILLGQLGSDADRFCAAISVPGPVCLRANRLLCTRDELARELTSEGLETHPAPRAADALYVVSTRPNLFALDSWRRGWFEPQDEGSQLLGALATGATVLDLCAGAGGKSLLLAARGAKVFAHDSDGGRLARLRTRAARAKAEIAIVNVPEPSDTVLVDAPCSELGALRRGPDARWRIQPQGFPALEKLQRDLLQTAARYARKRLVYATCTLRREENEEVALDFEESAPGWRRVPPEDCATADGFFRCLPHLHGTDGFFAAAWERA